MPKLSGKICLCPEQLREGLWWALCKLFFFFMMNAPVWMIEVKTNIAYSSQTSLKPQWKEEDLGSEELMKWSLQICCFGRKRICLWNNRYIHNQQMPRYGKWEKKSYPATYSAWWIETTYVRGHIPPWMLRVRVGGEKNEPYIMQGWETPICWVS